MNDNTQQNDENPADKRPASNGELGECTEVCECCHGVGRIKETEFIDGDESSCMTCNGRGYFTYVPGDQAEGSANTRPPARGR